MAYFRTYYYNCTSEADISYRVEFYDQAASVIFRSKEGTPGKSPVKIKWGSDGSSMFAPLKPSTCTINFMVTDLTSSNYIRQLRTERQEQDVYVAIFRETVVGSASPTEKPIWGGFILMDLSADPDQSVPYNVTLKAIDGIAALKYYDYVPTTTTQSPSNLYDIADTFIPDPGNSHSNWRTFKTIISDCFNYLGEFGIAEQNISNPTMRFAVSWFNGEMSSASVEPLSNTRVKAELLYKTENITDDITKYKPKTCYDVLKAVCKAWGMRLFYWRNCYYFIQINEFRNNQIGNQMFPEDIHNYEFQLDGTTIGSSISIQGFWGTYALVADSRYWGSKEKNKKRAGGQYGILPAFKKVTVDFLNVSNVNTFQGFPKIPVNGVAPVPFQYPNGTYETHQELFAWTSLGVHTSDGVNDQGYFNRLYQDVINNSIYDQKFYVRWGMFVRPSGTGSNDPDAGPVANGYTHVLHPDVSAPLMQEWYDVSWSLGYFGWPYDEYRQIPAASSTTIELSQSTYFGNLPLYPVFPAASFPAGDYDIVYYVQSDAYFDAATGALNGWDGHGKVAFTSGVSSPSSPYYWDISAHDVQINQGLGSSEFAPIVNGAVGSANNTTSLVQTGDDTSFQKINDILFGDTGFDNSAGCVQIYTGSLWKASAFSGLWGIDTLTGNNSMAQQLATDIISAQAKPIHKFTVSTVIDPTLGIYWADYGGANRPQYPFPGTKWTTKSHSGSGTLARDWIMHTGEFDIEQDTWKWVLYEQEYFPTGVTVTTTPHGGWNTGMVGGPKITHSTSGLGGSPMPKMGNPTSSNTALLTNMQKNASPPLATISVSQYVPQWDGSGEEPTYAQTITSLDVGEIPTAIFKTGDTITVHCSSMPRAIGSSIDRPKSLYPNLESFTVSADQLAGATSLSVTSKVIGLNIIVGDIIKLSEINLLSKVNTKQDDITLTTTGTSGAATFADNTLNVPQYSGGGSATSNYKYYVCTGTETSSSTVDVLSTVPYDSVQANSSSSNIIFYEAPGPSGKTNGEFSFSMGTGTFQIGWNVGTIPGTAFNRYLGGVKLQKGVLEGTAIVWSDVANTNSFIYDRGLSSTLQGGSTSNTILYTNTLTTNYFRIVFWKHQSSNSSTTLITQTDACGIYLIEQQ
jgi:hypothetical protein